MKQRLACTVAGRTVVLDEEAEMGTITVHPNDWMAYLQNGPLPAKTYLVREKTAAK